MTPTKRFWIAAALGISFGSPSPARADESAGKFGSDGQLILSADRLFGVGFTTQSTKDGDSGVTQTDSRTSIALLWPSVTPLTYSPYQIPRAAFDVAVASGFTVGGSIGFVSATGTSKTEPTTGPSTERDSPTLTVFALAPRIGYAVALSDQFAFWPRAGITYYNLHTKSTGTGATPTTSETTTSGLGVNIEPMFVFSPVTHFGITAGPVIDLPISGSSSRESTPSPAPAPSDDAVKFTNFGLTFGVLGYF